MSGAVSRVLRLLFGETKAAVRAGVCVLVCLLVIISAGYPGPRVPAIAFCVALACTAFFDLKRRLIFIGVIIFVQAFSMGMNGARVLLGEASELPEVAVPEVAASVVPGGDVFATRVSTQQSMKATVCFYKNGVAVVAAHECGLRPGVLHADTTLNYRKIEEQLLLLEDTPWGFAVKPIEPPVGRQELPIGNAADVSVGEPATCLLSENESFDVEIEGWSVRDGRPYLVVSSLHEITKGMSGVPVVQNGRIIGFLSATWPFSLRSPYVGYASPAASVYNDMKDHLESEAGP